MKTFKHTDWVGSQDHVGCVENKYVFRVAVPLEMVENQRNLHVVKPRFKFATEFDVVMNSEIIEAARGNRFRLVVVAQDDLKIVGLVKHIFLQGVVKQSA